MENQQITQLIRQELPLILRRDPEMREWVLRLTRKKYADKEETESRFDRILNELRRDREENARKWDANQRELERRREEQTRKWEEQNRKWDANQRELERRREEQANKWEEQNRKWEEQNRKWDANQATLNAMLAEIRALSRKHDSTIGALGARWGLQTESSFRNALAGILGESFGVEVRNETLRDEAGEVFGRPDQVELDVIIHNGLLILCEIKSSISKSDLVIFERKVRFYERQTQRHADRLIVISPMVDRRAYTLATELGIEVYSYAEDVPL